MKDREREREGTFAAQQMEADCKARAVKEDKYRALTFILLSFLLHFPPSSVAYSRLSLILVHDIPLQK